MSDHSAPFAAAEAAAAKPKPARKRWSLRVKVLLGVAFFVVLSTVIAVAAVISSLVLGGSVAKGQFAAAYDGAAVAAITDPHDNYKVTKALVAPTTTKTSATLPAGIELFYGEALDVTLGVKPDVGVTNRKAYVSGITTTTALPSGWSLKVVSGCGVVASPDVAGKPVKLRIEPSPEATGVLNLGTLGLRITMTALPDGATNADGSTVTGVTCGLKVG